MEADNKTDKPVADNGTSTGEEVNSVDSVSTAEAVSDTDEKHEKEIVLEELSDEEAQRLEAESEAETETEMEAEVEAEIEAEIEKETRSSTSTEPQVAKIEKSNLRWIWSLTVWLVALGLYGYTAYVFWHHLV